jgi:hypothetical protein
MLQNRVCAQDLQYFLETFRKPPNLQTDAKMDDWEDRVWTCLPWSSVPGMTDPLGIEPMAEGEEERWIPIAFLGFAATVMLVFAALVAPEMIGQTLFGSRSLSYVLPPQELNEILSY